MAKDKRDATVRAEQTALAARILYGVKQAYDTGKLPDELPTGSFDVLKARADKVVSAYNAAYRAWQRMPELVQKETKYILDRMEETLANRVAHEISQGIRMLNGGAHECENPIEELSETFKGSFGNHKYGDQDPSFYVHKLIARKLLSEPYRVVVEAKPDEEYEDMGFSLDDLEEMVPMPEPKPVEQMYKAEQYSDFDMLHEDPDYYDAQCKAAGVQSPSELAEENGRKAYMDAHSNAAGKLERQREAEQDLERIAASAD